MAVMLQSPNLIDPLHEYSEVSLLHRTLKGLIRSENSKQDDLQSVLDALAVKSSSKLQQQANTVLNSSSELLKSEFPQGMQSVYKDRDIPPRDKVHPQERRPALGRKRARFSMRPNISSQSSLGEDMSVKIDEYRDPEEIFRDFEKIERAKKEIQKQRGEISTDLTQHMSSTRVRSRRPGLLGRKAGFKPRFSSILNDLDETFGTSQKLSEVDSPSPSNSILNLATTDERRASQEIELVDDGCMDSPAEEKNKVDGFLDELLSKGCDGDRAVELLQERLQIKPIDVNKLCLTEVDSVRRSDANLSLEPSCRSIKSSSTVRSATKRVKSKGSVEKQQLVVNSTYSPDSPTPPRIPFSSVSMLSRRLSEPGRPSNPSLLSRIGDISPARNSMNEGMEKGTPSLHSDLNSDAMEINGDELRFSDKFASIITEKDKTATKDSTLSLDPVDDNSSKLVNHMNLGSNQSDGDLGEKIEDMQQPGRVGEEKNPVDSDMALNKLVTDDSAHSHDVMKDKVEDMQKAETVVKDKNPVDSNIVLAKLVTDDSSHSLDLVEGELYKFSNHMDLSSNGYDLEDNVEDMQQMETVISKQVENICDGLIVEDPHYSGSQLDISSSTMDKDILKDGHLENIVKLPEQNYQEPQESHGEFVGVHSKQKVPSLRQLPRRKNFADISGPTIDKDHEKDGHSENPTKLRKQNKQVHQESPSESLGVRSKQKGPSLRQISQGKSFAGESLKVQNKQKTQYLRERREVSRRKSLAGAGTQWKSNVRRSTRIKMRPFEFWRGERFLFKRVHESLLTVVGCQYTSPAKGDENPRLKMKSFVSDK